MRFTSINLVLLSAFCHALWNYYSKSSRDTRILFFYSGVFTLLIAFIVFGIKQPIIPKPVWGYIIGSALVHLLYRLFLSHAYTVGEISYVYPITRSAPAFLPLFAFLFLNELVSAQGLGGIFCVIVSILLYQQREARIQFKAFFRFLREPDSLWAYATLGSVIAYSLVDKQGMSEFHRYSTDSPWWRAGTFYLYREHYLTNTLWCRLYCQVSTTTYYSDWTDRMEAVSGCSCTGVDILFTHPLRFNDRKGQLCNCCSSVFCHFRSFARWLRLERNLYKTPICRCGCHGNRHFSDCISVTANIALSLFNFNRFLNRLNQKRHPI